MRPRIRTVEATPEDALINVVLTNGLSALGKYCESDLTDDHEKAPSDTEIPLWKHPAWDGWPGIWTNADGIRLHFGGMGLTYRR